MTKKTTTNETVATPVAPDTRQELRDKLLGHAPKPKREQVVLFGATIELQQPTLRAILDAQGIEDPKLRSTNMIIEYAYVPGSNEHVFEEADKEMILNWPFSEELVTLQLTIAKLTGVNVADTEKELIADPLKERS